MQPVMDDVNTLSQQSASSLQADKKGSFVVSGWGVVALFLAWGAILTYFPDYAGIHSWWAWFFRIVSYICYVIGILGAFVQLGQLFKNQFLASVSIACMFLGGAVALHLISKGTEVTGLLLRALQLGILGFLMFGVFGVFMSLQYLDPSSKKSKNKKEPRW